MFFNPALERIRWVACFDLLGTQALLAKGEQVNVFEAYTEARDKLRRDRQVVDRVRHTWFSDTFLIAAADDSGPSFTEIDLLARSFAHFLLCRRIPFRGAISCGQMYADFDDGVFLGLGMVEAYKYAEGQDWVGLVLCPSAMLRLSSFVSLDGRLNWQLFRIPWTARPAGCPDELLAYIAGQSFQVNGRNQALEALKEMSSSFGNGNVKVRQKYLRAIEFIEANRRTVVQNG